MKTATVRDILTYVGRNVILTAATPWKGSIGVLEDVSTVLAWGYWNVRVETPHNPQFPNGILLALKADEFAFLDEQNTNPEIPAHNP